MVENSKILISIIVPVFQVEKYLEKCIISIITQSYQELEIILIDDGSYDKSPIICDRYKNQDSRIKVIHQNNSGLSCARNVGLNIATGDYIGFVDSDDWIEPNMYEILLSDLLEANCDIVACGYKQENDETIFKNNNINTYNKIRYSTSEALKILINREKSINNAVWNKLYKKNILKNIKFSDNKIYEDVLWSAQVIGNTKNILYIDLPLYHYVYRHESLSHNEYIERRINDKIEMCEKRKDYISIYHPYLKKIAISNLLEFYYNEYKIIQYNYNHIDADFKIRHKIHKKFCELISSNVFHIRNTKNKILLLLFWCHPCFSFIIYKIYDKVRS